MTERDLRAHLEGMPERYDVRLHDLLFDEPVTCVDGRKPECIVGAPGGNAGLFVLLLAALEEAGERLSEADVAALFAAYVERFGHFYLHTDAPALARLAEAMRGDEALAAHRGRFETAEDAEAFLRRPPADARGALLALLAQPAHVGCGHLRLVAEHPDAYGVRPGLLQAFWRSYYEALWDGEERVLFDVLTGEHREEAVVSVVAEDETHGALAVPGLCPHHEGLQLFVAHPQAMSYLYREHAAFAEAQGRVAPDARAALVEAQEALAARGLAATLGHLAAGLPRFLVTARADGLSVARDGAVPS